MIAYATARRTLQIAVAAGSLVPVLAGAAGILWGPTMAGDGAASAVSLDSHFRYLSGLLFGIGIGFVSFIPAIEKKNPSFQLLAMIVFIGGLARLFALAAIGRPNGGMLFGLGMELLFTPLLALAQYRLSKRNPDANYRLATDRPHKA